MINPKNEWYTPARIINLARATMGEIDLDPASCAAANEIVQATQYYTQEDNGLTKPWIGRIWLNPPYSGGLIVPFVDKLLAETAWVFGQPIRVEQACVLVNNSTDTAWFHRLLRKSSAICLPEGRIKFWRSEGGPEAPRYGQAIFYLGAAIEDFRAAFSQIGVVLWT